VVKGANWFAVWAASVMSVPPWPSAAVNEARGHVVAKQRNLRDVGSLLDRDARQIDALLRTEVCHLAGEGRGLVEPQRAGWKGERYLSASGTLTSSTVPAAIVAGAFPHSRPR
jgi:hypothetical protein